MELDDGPNDNEENKDPEDGALHTMEGEIEHPHG